MTEILMPKATAVWLVDNTALTFEQIADFCGLHRLEVKGIADGDVAVGPVPEDAVEVDVPGGVEFGPGVEIRTVETLHGASLTRPLHRACPTMSPGPGLAPPHATTLAHPR